VDGLPITTVEYSTVTYEGWDVEDAWIHISEKTGVPVAVLQAYNVTDHPYNLASFVVPTVTASPTAQIRWVIEDGIVHAYDTSTWPGYGQVEQTVGANRVVAYEPENDTYWYVREDGKVVGRTTEEILHPVFDPNQAVNDWFEHMSYSDAAAFREVLLKSAYELMPYLAMFDLVTREQRRLTGDFSGDSQPSFEEFEQAFAGVSTLQLIAFSTELAQSAHTLQLAASTLFSGQEPLPEDEEALKALGLNSPEKIQEFIARFRELAPDYVEGLADLVNATTIDTISAGYMLAQRLDEVRQTLQEWEPERELGLLDTLQTEINELPTEILGVSVEFVSIGFQSFRDAMVERHQKLTQMQLLIEEYELNRDIEGENEQIAQTTMILLPVELIAGILWEPLDWGLSVINFVTYGDPLALVGLLPLIPNSIWRAIGRTVGNIPGLESLEDLEIFAVASSDNHPPIPEMTNPIDPAGLGITSAPRRYPFDTLWPMRRFTDANIENQVGQYIRYLPDEYAILYEASGDIPLALRGTSTAIDFGRGEELLIYENLYGIHNHPPMTLEEIVQKGIPTYTISIPDLNVAVVANLAEFRATAVTLEGETLTFVIRRTQPNWGFTVPSESTPMQALSLRASQASTILAERYNQLYEEFLAGYYKVNPADDIPSQVRAASFAANQTMIQLSKEFDFTYWVSSH
jgi:hypothetical protein